MQDVDQIGQLNISNIDCSRFNVGFPIIIIISSEWKVKLQSKVLPAVSAVVTLAHLRASTSHAEEHLEGQVALGDSMLHDKALHCGCSGLIPHHFQQPHGSG